MATPRGIRYIPAIDGLRAVAVIAVMLYHLGFKWIPGGFLAALFLAGAFFAVFFADFLTALRGALSAGRVR